MYNHYLIHIIYNIVGYTYVWLCTFTQLYQCDVWPDKCFSRTSDHTVQYSYSLIPMKPYIHLIDVGMVYRYLKDLCRCILTFKICQFISWLKSLSLYKC